MGRPFNCNKCNKPKRPKGNAFKDLPGYCACGRPTVFDKDTVQKLEDAFSYCYTDLEACLYAKISPRALYNYQKDNPEFVQRKEMLRMSPNLKVKKTLIDNVGTISVAQWWALHKMNDEFGEKKKLELSGAVNTSADPDLDQEKAALRAEFNKKHRELLIKARLKKNTNENPK